MKFRFSWPFAIVLAIVLFMAYILNFVYKAMASPEYNHELVTEDYYHKELKYQEEIDKQKRGLKLEQNITLQKTDEGIYIVFPNEFEPKEITGTIELLRLSDENADVSVPIITKKHEILIENDKLIKGTYRLTVDWEAKGESYMYKKDITY